MERSKEFQEFCNQIQEAVRERFSEKVKVEIHQVLKNNSTELDGLVILSPKQTVSPNFYLQLYYEEYKNGADIASLAQKIEETYNEILCSGNTPELDLSYGRCEEKIVFRLISYEENTGLLKAVPFIRFLDMAVTFHILMRQDDEGIGSVRITNRLLENWDLDTNALFTLAKQNTKRIFPQKIYTMSSMMAAILDSGEYDGNQEIFALAGDGYAEQVKEPYVVTNSNGINGAAVILYENALKEIGEFLGEDYYLLPSSIHELLAIPASAPLTEAEMQEMVEEVNQSCVAREEVLSNSVYRYECGTESIRICAK